MDQHNGPFYMMMIKIAKQLKYGPIKLIYFNISHE